MTMVEVLKGTVQYNDLIGECACDGEMGAHHTIWKDEGLSEDYFPLAMSISKWESGNVSFVIYSCKKSDYGSDFDSILGKAKSEGKIRVERFPIELDFDKFMKYMKRFNMVLRQKGIEGYDLVYDV